MKDLININRLNRFGQNIWNRIKNTFMTKEDAINGVLVGQEWTKIGSVLANTSISLPPTDTFTELYIEMYSSNGTITHNINIRLDSILFESSNNEYREILLDSVYDAQTYVKYDFATNSIIPIMYEGNMIDSSSTEITTNVYTKTNKLEVGNIEAEKITIDNTKNELNATNTQEAIDEISRTIGYSKSYNLLPCNKTAGSWNGMTYTPILNSEGLLEYYSLSGKRDAETYYEIYRGPLPKGLEVGKTYKINTNTTEGRFYMYIYQTVNGVGEQAVSTLTDGENALWTIKENTTEIIVRISIIVTSGTFTNVRFYPMIRPAEIEDSSYKPYIEDLKTIVTNNFENIFVDYRKTFVAKTGQAVYQKVVDRKCAVHLTHNGFYGAGFMMQVDIYAKDKLMAMTKVHPGGYTPNMSSISCSANFVLEKGDTITCYALTNADGENTGNVTGYIHYLE